MPSQRQAPALGLIASCVRPRVLLRWPALCPALVDTARSTMRQMISLLAKEKPEGGINHDQAGKDQGDRELGLFLHPLYPLGLLRPLRRRTFEGGNVVAGRSDSNLLGFDVRCRARAAHL